MRTSILRVTATAFIGLSVVACSPAIDPFPTATGSPTTPSSIRSAVATPFASATPTSGAFTPPAPAPAPPTGTLPVRGSGQEIGNRVQMHPGPAGGLYVLISTERQSVVTLLDSAGGNAPGWPVALEDTYCLLPPPAGDGSIRVVCAVNSETRGRAYAFASDGRSIAGWPVDLPTAATAGVADRDLVVMAYVDENHGVKGLRLVTVAPDGSVRTGTPVERPDSSEQDAVPQLGPDGTGYLLAYPNSATGETEITAFDIDGLREGWLIRVKGRPSGLAFGPDGHIHLTEGLEGQTSTRIRVFDEDGRPLSISADLPIAATSAYQGAGPLGGAPPPSVAQEFSSLFVSENGGTTAYRVDETGSVVGGWPYQDDIGLQWSYVAPGDTGTPSWRSDPAVGPGPVLYLLHPPRGSNVGGSVMAIGPSGSVRPGWPVTLNDPGATFRSVVVGPDETVYALALEPERDGRSSATILAISPDSTVRYRTTIVEP